MRYLPALLRAAVITLVLSCPVDGAGGRPRRAASRAAASTAAGPLQVALTAWVELIRGTPLLLQLFVLYFGLAPFVQLPAFVAGAASGSA